MREQDYPGIWVQFEDTDDLERAGIAHTEFIRDDQGVLREVTRWRFGGNFSFTVSAMSNQERDRLYDEVVRVLAFSGTEDGPSGQFKQIIEANDLIGLNFNFDVLSPSGDAANPGTPWESSEVIYEKTLSVKVIGEFISDYTQNALYALSKIIVQPYIEGLDDDDLPDLGNSDGNDDSYQPGEWI